MYCTSGISSSYNKKYQHDGRDETKPFDGWWFESPKTEKHCTKEEKMIKCLEDKTSGCVTQNKTKDLDEALDEFRMKLYVGLKQKLKIINSSVVTLLLTKFCKNYFNVTATAA